MPKNGVNVRVNLDVSDAVSTAKELGKQIEDAIQRNKGTTDPRVAKLIQDLQALQAQYEAVLRSMDEEGNKSKAQQQLFAEAAIEEERASRALNEFENQISSTNDGLARLIETIREYE